jgi:hypothetical protein
MRMQWSSLRLCPHVHLEESLSWVQKQACWTRVTELEAPILGIVLWCSSSTIALDDWCCEPWRFAQCTTWLWSTPPTIFIPQRLEYWVCLGTDNLPVWGTFSSAWSLFLKFLCISATVSLACLISRTCRSCWSEYCRFPIASVSTI